MLIKSGQKISLISAVLVCTMLFAIGVNGIPMASAASQSSSDPTSVSEKSLTITNDILGLDISKYNTRIDSYIQDLYFDTLPQELVKYTFESDKNKLEVIYVYVNGNLRSLTTYADGALQTLEPKTNPIEMSKNFLNNYQTFSGAQYYDTIRQMLKDVEPNKNVTKTLEDMKLSVIYGNDTAEFRWTYIANGVEAQSKCVALFFEQDSLKYFIDTWSLYKIGNADINISEEEAIRIAMDRAKSYSWNVSLGGDNWADNLTEVTEFNIAGVRETTLSLVNYVESTEARNSEPLTLYPSWRVHLDLDKIYAGNVYGLDVGIWADTKDVHDIRTMFSLSAYPTTEDNEISVQSPDQINPNSSSSLPPFIWIVIPVAIGIILTVSIVLRRKNNTKPFNQGLLKRSVKISGFFLCLLTAFAIFPMAIPTANASRSIALYGSTWNIVTAELNEAVDIINDFEYYFDVYAGYDCFDAFGSSTQKANILSWAPVLEENYDHVTMFHYGHAGYDNINGIRHWSYYDNDGPSTSADYVWDHEVYPQTWRSKTWFVMLWSCRQGDSGAYPGYTDAYGKAVGMPYAWHHPP